MKLTLQIKLLPNAEQHDALLKTMHVFNDACNFIAEVAFREQCTSKFSLQKMVYADVRALFGLSAQLTVRAIGKVIEAYKRDNSIQCFFRPTGATIYDQRVLSFKGLEAVSILTMAGRLTIPMQMGEYQRVQFNRGHGQADLVLVDGTFYLLLVVETPEAPPTPPTGFLGVDLGIVQIASDSDGQSFSGAAVEATRRRYHSARKALQACGSRSAKRHLKRINRTEARFRKDTNHVISKTLVLKAKGTGRGIGLEDLKHIRARTTVRRADRAKHSGWSFFQLQSFVEYKAKLHGVVVQYIDPRNTSRTCCACGHIAKANRKTQSSFLCVSCGHTANADDNAAMNIATKAAVKQPIVACDDRNGCREHSYKLRPSGRGR
jgi:IS605 OrfB family transposase